MKRQPVILIIVLSFVVGCASGIWLYSLYKTENRKTKSEIFLLEAYNDYKDRNYYQAMLNLGGSIIFMKKQYEAYLLLANIYEELDKPGLALCTYKKAIPFMSVDNCYYACRTMSNLEKKRYKKIIDIEKVQVLNKIKQLTTSKSVARPCMDQF